MSNATTRALGIFAKEPREGLVKTRLAAATSPYWAAQVAEAFLRDTVQRLSDAAAERFLAFSPTAAGPYFQSLARHHFQILPQGDGDLGQRLQRYFAARFADGFRQIVVLGADSPTLPAAIIEQAFANLDQADVVLGPATDGGYYLLGLTRPLDSIFHDVDWGSNKVLEQTVAQLSSEGSRLALLPPWYDVDTIEDWQMLRGHVAAMRRARCDPQIPYTERLLALDHPMRDER